MADATLRGLGAGLILLLSAAAAADEIGDALEASQQAVRAARESQARINKLDDETRALQEKERTAEWRAQQMSAYAEQLEQEARHEEERRARLESELARIGSIEKELLPLIHRMLAQLEQWVAADVPFLQASRRKRVEDLKALVADPAKGIADKYRRVLDAYRSEVDYGYSLSTEEARVDLGEGAEAVSVVRLGRVGLYCVTADGDRAGVWDHTARRWQVLDDDAAEDVQRALAVAREEAPPELLTLPVAVPR